MDERFRASRILASIGAMVLLAMATGCSGAKLYPVEGTIVFADNRPAAELAGASVQFDPLDGNIGARGELKEDGTFTLGTYQPGDGVAPGEYRVSIQPPLPALDRPAKRILDSRYENINTSDLRVIVKAENNRVTLKVQRFAPPE